VATADVQIAGVAGRLLWSERLGNALTSTGFLGVVVAVLSWPIFSIVPASGPDASWQAGLYMAHSQGLHFGTELVFTYGPLGFLQAPVLYEQGMWVLAFVFQLTIHTAVAVVLLWTARRALPLGLAVVACYVLLVIGGLQAAAVLLAFACCFVALDEAPPRWAAARVVVLGGGALSAFELLVKANYGVAIFGMATVTLLGLSNRRRNLPLFGAATVSVFAACWVASGQAIADVPAFLWHSEQVVSGYSAAMATDIAAQHWERAAALLAVGTLTGAALLAAWGDRSGRRIASVVLVLLFSFMAFKQGFVRQGLGNTPEFFVLIAAAGIVVASRLPTRRPRLAALGLVVPLIGLALIVLPTQSIWQSLKPAPHVEFLRQDLDALASSGVRTQTIAEARHNLRSSYRLDPSILAAVGDRGVHIDPWEIGVAWAYGLSWHPLPVIQSYSAYTPQLDRLNAVALGGSDAPSMVLRHRSATTIGSLGSIDGRFPGWESPEAMRAMLCNYRAIRTTRRWQLLERNESHCGPVTPIGIVHGRTDEWIHIPPPQPGSVVFTRVAGIGMAGLESARSLLYRARDRTATLSGQGTWRVVPATAGDGLILAAAPGVDFPRPFGLAPHSGAIHFHIAGLSRRPITLRFFAQVVR